MTADADTGGRALRVLVVKLSSLGDIVHALPVVADIHAAHAEATVDWVVEPAFASLFDRVPGVDAVVEAPLRAGRSRGWLSGRTLGTLRRFVERLRQERYDAVVDLQGLAKSALVARLARGPSWGLGNRTLGAGWERPARWLVEHPVRVEPRVHVVDRSRLVVAAALGTRVGTAPDFGLAVPGIVRSPASRGVAFVHGTSRDDKRWPDGHWVELGRRIVASGWRPQLVQGSASEAARAERLAAAIGAASCDVWPSLGIAGLVDRLAACAGVVGVDSGPSHVATALGLPHVQLYNHPTAWRTGPPVEARRQIALEGLPAVDTVWDAWLRVTAPPA